MAWVTGGNLYVIDLEESSSQYLSRTNGGTYDLTTGTVEAWIKLESLPTVTAHTYGIISTQVNAGLQGFFVDVSSATNKLECGFGGTIKITGTAALTAASYVHVAFAWDTSGSELIVNGVSNATGTAATLTASGNNLQVGNSPSAGNLYFDGKIDDVRVWNTKRTATQVNANKDTELTGSESGLLSYWKLNNDLLDSTSGGRTLTNNNAAVFATDPAFVYTVYANALSETSGAPVESLTMTTGVTFTLSDTAGVPTESLTFKRMPQNTSKSSSTWTNVQKS